MTDGDFPAIDQLRASSVNLMAARLREDLEASLSATWRGRLALRIGRWRLRRRRGGENG